MYTTNNIAYNKSKDAQNRDVNTNKYIIMLIS